MASLAPMLLSGAMVVTALALALPSPAMSQMQGGTLRIYNSSNPPSASPHEDTSIAVVMPFMAVYKWCALIPPSRATVSPPAGEDVAVGSNQDAAHLQATHRREMA